MSQPGRFVVVPVCMAVLLACASACGGGTTASEDTVAKEEKAKKPAKAADPKPDAKVPTEPDPTPGKALPATPPTLADAAARAAEVYADHRVTFWCGCSYTTDMRTIRQSCGYKTRADESLAHEITWAHVVPARAFGAHRACWTTEACKRDDGTSFGGIECCRQRDPVFSRMETDLINLVPEIAEVDKDRSDFPFGTLKGEPRMYGACDIEVDGQAALVEPPDKVRGDIARVYLYMRQVYGDDLRVPAEQWTLLEQWNTEDPLDEWETKRAARVAEMQREGGAAATPVAKPAAPAPDAKAPAADAKAPAGDAKAPAAPAPAGDAKAPAPEGKGAAPTLEGG